MHLYVLFSWTWGGGGKLCLRIFGIAKMVIIVIGVLHRSIKYNYYYIETITAFDGKHKVR